MVRERSLVTQSIVKVKHRLTIGEFISCVLLLRPPSRLNVAAALMRSKLLELDRTFGVHGSFLSPGMCAKLVKYING